MSHCIYRLYDEASIINNVIMGLGALLLLPNRLDTRLETRNVVCTTSIINNGLLIQLIIMPHCQTEGYEVRLSTVGGSLASMIRNRIQGSTKVDGPHKIRARGEVC